MQIRDTPVKLVVVTMLITILTGQSALENKYQKLNIMDVETAQKDLGFQMKFQIEIQKKNYKGSDTEITLWSLKAVTDFLQVMRPTPKYL